VLTVAHGIAQVGAKFDTGQSTSLREVASGLQFPEGPISLRDGSLLVVEVRRGTLTRVRPDGTTDVVAELGDGPNGAAVGPDGAIYVCNNGGFEWHDDGGIAAPGNQPDDFVGGKIQRVTLDGAVTDLYTEVDGRKLRGPNDIVFDSAGGFWFTDHGKRRQRESDTGAVYYAQADGSSITEVLHPVTTPNGIGLSPDGSRLYVAETGPGRVWSWPVIAPGRLGREETFLRAPAGGSLVHGFPGFQMLDSLAIDGMGDICVATLITGAISRLSPNGELLDQFAVPEADPFVTNICFAGSHSRTAWITSSGRGKLYTMEWPCAGADLPYSL
jgi:gluconolactonase